MDKNKTAIKKDVPSLWLLFFISVPLVPACPQELRSSVLCLQVRPYEHLQKLVSVNMTDKISRVIVCGYVGRIL